MAEVDPLYLEVGSPNKVLRTTSGETVPRDLIPDVTISQKGAMTASDKTKLNAIEAGATADQEGKLSVTTDAGDENKIQLVNDADTPGANQVYGTDGVGTKGWKADPAGGGGSIGGTVGSVDNRLTRSDGTGGDTLQETGIVVDDTDNVSGIGTLDTTGDVNGRDMIADGVKLTTIDTGAKAPPYTGAQIDTDTVTAANIAPGTITSAEIAGGTIGSAELGVDSVGSSELADNAVDTLAIQDDAVTQAKIAPNAIGPTEIQTNAVTDSELANDAVDTDAIQDGAVTNAKIGAGEVNGTSIAPNAVDGTHIITGAVGSDEIAANSVNTSELVNDSVTNDIAADMAEETIKGRAQSAGTGDPQDLTASQVRTILNVISGAQPNNATNVGGLGGASLVKQVLGDGTIEVWKLQAGDTSATVLVEFDAVDGYKFSVGALSITQAELALGAVNNARLDDMPNLTWKGRVSPSTGVPENITPQEMYEALDFVPGQQTFQALQFPPLDPIQTLHIQNTNWVAGLAGAAPAHSNLYPFMTFTAIDDNEHPHVDHNDLAFGDQDSGYEGYLDGLRIAAGVMNFGQRIRFSAVGAIKNEVAYGYDDGFVEFVLEPNPTLGAYAGANRIRMLSGEFGARWTGTKAFKWTAEFVMGEATQQDSYHVEWSMEIEDVMHTSGIERITGGQNFRDNDVYLCPRFRIDEITNLDTYDATYQGVDDGGGMPAFPDDFMFWVNITEYFAGPVR